MRLSKAPLPPGMRQSQRGLGLVEIMIAMLLVGIMFNGLMEIFLSSRQTYNATDNLTRLQENGRTTVDILVAGLRRSGYLGGNSDASTIFGSLGRVNGAATCAVNSTNWARMIDQPVYGLNDDKANDATDNNANAGYACIPDDDPDADYLRGDILTLRYASPWVVATADFADKTVYLRTSLFNGKLFLGEDAAESLNVLDETPQRQHQLLSYSYYVADTGRTCNEAAVPGLFREALDQDSAPEAEELIAGIENIQFRYNVGNKYVDAGDSELDELAEWDNVQSVKLWVLARAECPETGYLDARTYVLGDIPDATPADSYRRQLFSTVVALRN